MFDCAYMEMKYWFKLILTNEVAATVKRVNFETVKYRFLYMVMQMAEVLMYFSFKILYFVVIIFFNYFCAHAFDNNPTRITEEHLNRIPFYTGINPQSKAMMSVQ